MKYKPHPYQAKGQQLLTSTLGGAGLGLDPGMGKTGIALSGYDYLYKIYEGLKALVIVPINPMYGTWPDELAKWDYPYTVSIIHGTPKQRMKALHAEADIYLINPEGVAWLFAEGIVPHHPDWKLLIVDESTKFKRTTTGRFKALKPHLGQFFWRWIMTGTIAPNGLEDLFGQCYVMDEGRSLGKYITHFRQTYFYQTGYKGYKWVPKEGATERVTKRIESRILLLKAEDWLEMPDIMYHDRRIELSNDAQLLYDQFEQDFVLELGEHDIVASNAAALGTKLRQVSNGFAYDDKGTPVPLHDDKLEALQDIAEETNGHPLLIMYEFKHDRDRIQKLFGKDCVCATGLTGDKLVGVQKRFNSGNLKYLLMHPGSTHGMNLQKHCHHIVWFSTIWNLEHYLQANTRLYRQGQESQSVMVYHIVSKGTVDETVSAALRAKDRTQQSIENSIRRHCGVAELPERTSQPPEEPSDEEGFHPAPARQAGAA